MATNMGDRKYRTWPGALALVVVTVSLGWVVLGNASSGDMEQLPVSSRFQCLNCHLSDQPSAANFDLNAFGQDFLDNGRIWNVDLAVLDSDSDGCLNGVELGDSDGDGQLDGNVAQEMGNPGQVDDCSGGALTNETTWGALKALFDSD